MRKHKFSKSRYQQGLDAANAEIDSLLKKSPRGCNVRECAEELHDKADHEQFTLRAKYGDKAAEYSQGKAMGFGQYAHTGRRILK